MALKNKYQRQKEQYSTDGGITWLDVTPPNYRKGNVIETGSDDCNTIEWIEVEGSWFCIGTDTVTRWVIATNEYMCSNGNKYQKEKEQISYDNGVTWEDTGNARNGSLIEADSEDCIYETQYLTFEFLESGSLNIVASNASVAKDISYSTDNGTTWNTITTSTTSQSFGNFSTGDKLLIKGNNSAYATSNIVYNRFYGKTRVNVYGNIMSLIYGDNFIGRTTISPNYALSGIFDSCTGIVSAENLKLPATTLTQDCYSHMFWNCTSLVTAPRELPAATLADYCYYEMFRGCTSLTTAPLLPATTLAINCYDGMFMNCSSLTTAPQLPATKLRGYCYAAMFDGCTSLTTAPSLPATNLTTYCYAAMFDGCTSLTTPPTLSATTMATQCYAYMFRNCTSLVTAPVLPATTLKTYCYEQMFKGCTSLNYIKAMFTTTPSTSYTRSWVEGVSSSGTFVKNAAASWNETGDNGVPSGWTIQTASE